MVLSQATGSVSSGNLSVFENIGSKAHGIAVNDIVAIGNKESTLLVEVSMYKVVCVSCISHSWLVYFPERNLCQEPPIFPVEHAR